MLMTCCGGAAGRWACPKAGPRQQVSKVLLWWVRLPFLSKILPLALQNLVFSLSWGTYFCFQSIWGKLMAKLCSLAKLLRPPVMHLGCNIYPPSEGCRLWELRLGCARWIIKRKLATAEWALQSTGAQWSLPYLYHGAVSLKWVIIYLQLCEALSRVA